LPLEGIARRVEAMVVTRGADGSSIHTDGRVLSIPAVAPTALSDPTGCGDAYRAGLLYGIARQWEWERTGRLAAILGALKIAAQGGQNHAIDREAMAVLYDEAFHGDLW
jgi:adenosine kinase